MIRTWAGDMPQLEATSTIFSIPVSILATSFSLHLFLFFFFFCTHVSCQHHDSPSGPPSEGSGQGALSQLALVGRRVVGVP